MEKYIDVTKNLLTEAQTYFVTTFKDGASLTNVIDKIEDRFDAYKKAYIDNLYKNDKRYFSRVKRIKKEILMLKMVCLVMKLNKKPFCDTLNFVKHNLDECAQQVLENIKSAEYSTFVQENSLEK